MVEQKKTKRERDIKSKLMAAIAMLLVSSIMMVSTTYAWFTLSTAPEVTGITTTIASNGNLEIALSPVSGQGADVKDAAPGTTDWTEKNLTWGNMLDMSDASYGLADIVLAPSELYVSGDALVATQALATPHYGNDGRISALEADAVMAHKVEAGFVKPATTDGTTEAFKYGVRAVGTASGRSAQEIQFTSSVNAINSYANAIVGAANGSLGNNGQALASILVQHATAKGGSDTSDYTNYRADLIKLTTTLKTIPENIDNALRSALLAAVCTMETAQFNAAVEYIEEKDAEGNYVNDVDDLIAGFTIPAEGEGASAISISIPAAVTEKLNAIIAERDTISDAIDAADSAATQLPTSGVVWNNVSPILGNLMNVDNETSIKVGGKTVTEVKAMMVNIDQTAIDFVTSLFTTCKIELLEDSGVYYNIAQVAGNISAKTTATIDASAFVSGMNNVTLQNVNIVATCADPSSLTELQTAANALSNNVKSDGVATVDAFYGYIIDLMVRTNAADSKLMLQSAPAQRVYDNSGNPNTMGGGSSIIFKVLTEEDALAIYDLCMSMRVVFFDPADGNKIMSLAKVNSVNITDGKVIVKSAEGVEEEKDGKIVTGTIELCQMVADGTDGLYVAGDAKTDATLCNLTQNVAKAISAMVYLDGTNITSSDVLAKDNVVGMLNLQFASSAELKPMENSDLFGGTEPTESQTPAQGG